MEEREEYLGKRIEECANEVAFESRKGAENPGEMMKEKARKLEQEMKDKYKELTGKEDGVDYKGLYLNIIREHLLRYGFITQEEDEEAKNLYKKEGRILGMGEIKKRKKKEKGYSDENSFKKISGFEDSIMFAAQYANDGWVSPGYFFNKMHDFLGDEAIKRERAKAGITIQKNLAETTGSAMDDVKNEAERNKNATFNEMVRNRRNWYETEKKNQNIGEKFSDMQSQGKDNLEIFKKFESDPLISKDLNDILVEYRDFYSNIKDIEHMRALSVSRQAELVGLNHI